MYMKLLGIMSVGINVTDQLLIRFFAFVRYWRKNGSTMRQYSSYSKTSRKLMIELGRKCSTTFSKSLGYP
jgi:hypothetical protein